MFPVNFQLNFRFLNYLVSQRLTFDVLLTQLTLFWLNLKLKSSLSVRNLNKSSDKKIDLETVIKKCTKIKLDLVIQNQE